MIGEYYNMSIRDIDNYDLFKRFFGNSGSNRRGFFGIDPFRAFEDMQQEMERMFSQINNIQTNAPKELVREYQTPDGGTVREVGPIVYGYSMTIGPDGKPKVREFGNVNSIGQAMGKATAGIEGGVSSGSGGRTNNGNSKNVDNSQITVEREPLVDVNVTDKEVKVVMEMPGIKKDEIRINAYDGEVEVFANNPQRKYHKTIELPLDSDIESVKSTYNNGILEITFNKKKNMKPKGREIKIE
jgi:HSP20 family protein